MRPEDELAELRAALRRVEALWQEFVDADEAGEFGDRCDNDPCRVCTLGQQLQEAAFIARRARP